MMPMPTEPMTAQAPHTVVFARELAHDLWQEAMPLFEAHRQEISHYPDILLNLDVAAYCAMEDAGTLRCFTARRHGALVGYCVYFVRHNLRYRDSLQANMDVLYVRPDDRRGRVGADLVRYTEEVLRAEGVQVAYQHVKAKTALDRIVLIGIGRLLQRLGYEVVDLIFAKRLDRQKEGPNGY